MQCLFKFILFKLPKNHNYFRKKFFLILKINFVKEGKVLQNEKILQFIELFKKFRIIATYKLS